MLAGRDIDSYYWAPMPTLIIALAAGILMLANQAYACSCDGERTVKEQLRSADAVFVGRVIEQSKTGLTTFHVAAVWKGNTGKTAKLRTLEVQKDFIIYSTCDYQFVLNEEYLVYAYYNDKHELKTSICTRTTSLFEAGDDFDVLGKVKRLK